MNTGLVIILGLVSKIDFIIIKKSDLLLSLSLRDRRVLIFPCFFGEEMNGYTEKVTWLDG
ncbi:MAG: hypothetical protein QNJ18_08845 [Xenococcaceae cyanobacterium MO_167.B52]|nr:hypothetical protein [Xenococcaceae cyanobacterium MO_167.B52]